MKILRWIAVLPASFLAMILSTIILKFMNLFFWSEQDIDADSLIFQCLLGSVNVLAFIYAGVYTAPNYKKIVLPILSILAVLIEFFILFQFYNIIIESLKDIEWTFWNNLGLILIFRTIASIISALYIYFALKSDEL